MCKQIRTKLTKIKMPGGVTSLATYAQRSVTIFLVGLTCYYGASLFQTSYLARKKRLERAAKQEAEAVVNVMLYL